MNKPISRHLNLAVLHIASRLFPTGFDVAPDAPDTFDKLCNHIESTGRMLVWNGASEKTIYADNEVNFCFRAWHDWVHFTHKLPFTPEAEKEAARIQLDHLETLYRGSPFLPEMKDLIWAEVAGQVDYQLAHGGEFPSDQSAFVLAYLNDPAAAVSATF